MGRFWGIGQKSKNNGVLLIVAPREHKVRIEVGYGLEGRLTDALSSSIINRDILPTFRRGDFDAGVLAGTGSIIEVLNGKEVSNTESSLAWDRQNSVGFDDPMLWLAILLVAGWGLLFLMLYLIGPRYHPDKKSYILYRSRRSLAGPLGLPRNIPRGWYLPGVGFGRAGGGLGGAGGFSGGGGSFGGGGASGSW
jgi:uncharacterized protein